MSEPKPLTKSDLLRIDRDSEFREGKVALTSADFRALLSMASRAEAAEAELEKVSRRLRWYRAAHMLVADEFAWVGHREKGDVRLAFLAKDENWDPILYIMCSDTFAWACADAERAEYADAEKLLAIAVEDGWYGLIRWVQSERERRGEIEEPIAPVKKMFADYDSVKRERDELRLEVERLKRPPAWDRIPDCPDDKPDDVEPLL